MQVKQSKSISKHEPKSEPTSKPRVYLASRSPRRAELLMQMGVKFCQLDTSIPEIRNKNESCDDYVFRLAQEKAQAGLNSRMDENLIVIGADTVILFGDQIMEKPVNEHDGLNMLTLLSNNIHLVKTALSICDRNRCETIIQTNQVTMAEMSRAEISAYWRSGEPCDKAGGYAIQGRGAMFIEHIEGSYSGIMGLPIYDTSRLLSKFGIDPNLSS